MGFGDRVNAMKMKSCYSALHYVFRVASLHKILPRFDKLMEGYRSENGKSETFLEVRDFDRRPECLSLMRIELRIRAAARKLESQIDSHVAIASSGTNFASSIVRHFPHDTLGWVGLRVSVAWRL